MVNFPVSKFIHRVAIPLNQQFWTYPYMFMHGTPVVSAMPMALIGRLIALVRVVYCDIMSTQHFAVRQSRVGPLWLSIEALLEPFLIKKPK